MCKNNVIFAEKSLIMAPKWIFFDLDDTLFDFSTGSLISLRQLWNETPMLRSRFRSDEAFIEEYHINNRQMWDLHERGEITADFLKSERFRLTFAPENNDDATIRVARWLNDRYLDLLGQCDCVCPGATDVLKKLGKSYLIGVLTNGFTEVQYKKLQSTGLARYIQRMVISDEIGIQKPDPKIFRYAEQATGATEKNVVMIGDNPQNDIAGALEAGWKAIYYDRKGKPFSSDSANYLGRIENLNEIEGILAGDH